MKKLLPILCVLASAPAAASDIYICTITSTGTSVNSSTVAGCTSGTFKVGTNVHLAVQCDAPARVAAVATSTGAATANDVKIDTDVLFDIKTRPTEKFLAVISVSGTANCRVYHVQKQ